MSQVHRRSILQGFTLGAGALLLDPVVRQLELHASGAAQRPKRFVFVVEGNGVTPQQVVPVGIKYKSDAQSRTNAQTMREESLADHALPFALEPLTPFKQRMAIVQNLSGRICGGGHSNNFGALGVYSSKAGAYDQTIDAALARALPGIFPHVGLGISDRAEHSIIYNISASGRNQPMPTQCNPDLAYSTLFGSVAPGSGRQAFDAQTNLLDFMSQDIKRLESRLAGEEKQRLQNYLGSFESMRERQSRLNDIEATLRAKAPVVTNKYKSAVETDRLDAQFDIGTAALISGLTNVLTISSGAGDPYFSVRFKGLGIDLDKHSIGHGKGIGERDSQMLSSTIRRFHMELIARFATKLQAMPEGDGTMLDNTLIIYLSDAAEGHHSRCWEWPVVMLGNLGGVLKINGRYLEYPNYGRPGHRTMANLYTTFLQLAGVKRDHFGQIDPGLKDLDQRGPLAELLA